MKILFQKINDRVWRVEKGYESNGITAPASIKARLGDGVKHPETWAAVFHDWLFTQPGVSRALADRTFRDLMIAYHVSPEKTEMLYDTVKLCSLSKSFR